MKVVLKEPGLMFLPVISSVLFMIMFFAMVIPGAILFPDADKAPIYWGIVGILSYFIGFFFTYFTQFMIVGIAKARFEGKDPKISDGFAVAKENLKTIVLFSAIGSVIAILANLARKQKGIGGMIANLLMSFLGASWTVISYLSIPVIVHEKVGVMDSFKRTGEIVKTSFKEGLGAMLSTGLIFTIVSVVGIIIAVIGFFMLLTVNLILGIIVLALGILVILLSTITSKVVNAILGEALYYYAKNGKMPDVLEGISITGDVADPKVAPAPTTAQPVDNTQTSTQQPPAQDTTQPPAQDTTQPPAQDTTQPPAQDTTQPPAQDTPPQSTETEEKDDFPNIGKNDKKFPPGPPPGY